MFSKIKLSKKTVVKAAIVTVCAAIGTFLLFRTFAASGQIKLSTDVSSVKQDDTFVVTVSIDSGSEPVSIGHAYITYDPTQLQYVSTDYNTSSFTDNSPEAGVGSGYVVLSRYNLDGVTGNLTLGKITFKALAEQGTAAVTVDQSKSKVYSKADASEILNGVTNTSVTLTQKITAGDQPSAGSASLDIASSSKTAQQSDLFTLSVTAKAGTSRISTARAYITFNKSLVQYSSIDYTGSPLNTGIAGDPVVGDGSIQFDRYNLDNPPSGDVLVAKVTFKAVATGSAAFAVDTAQSLVTEYVSGQAPQNILNDATGTSVTITAAPTTGGGSGGGSGGGPTTTPPTTTPPVTVPPVSVPKGGTVTAPSVPQTSTGKKVVRTDYYLNKQYVGTSTNGEGVDINTENLQPGEYDLTANSQAEDGSFEETNQAVTISPPSFIIRYKTPIALSAVSVLAAVGFMVVRFVFLKAAPFYKTLG